MRPVSTATLLSWRTSRCRRDGATAGASPRGDNGHGNATSISASDGSARLRHRSQALISGAGEGEEHIVERGLVEGHVIDGYARLVERTHDRGRQSVTTADRRPQAPAVVADLNRTVDIWLERPDRRGVGALRVTSRRAPPIFVFSSGAVPAAITRP